MAEQTQFIKYVQKYFTGFIASVYKTINGEKNAPKYLYKSMLTPKPSVDGKWTSLLADNQNVAADVVAMDSPLPLKSRPSLGSVSGDIPKLGMELKMNENQLDQVDTMRAKNADIKEITEEIFDDTKRCIVGVEEQKEYLFLRGFSSGVALTDSDNVGSGIRVNYGYVNQAGSTVILSQANLATATPIADIRTQIDKADDAGVTIGYMSLDKATLDLMRNTNETKDLYAVYSGNFGTTKPAPSAKNYPDFLEAELGVKVIVVNRSIKFEKDGVKKTVKAWDAGKIILHPDINVGQLVWKKPVEADHQSKAVEYRMGEHGALISKYVTHKPFGEWTDIQARALPVINNVNEIFQLDTKIVQA